MSDAVANRNKVAFVLLYHERAVQLRVYKLFHTKNIIMRFKIFSTQTLV